MKNLSKVVTIVALSLTLGIQFMPSALALTCGIDEKLVTDEKGNQYCQDLSDLGS